MSESDVPPTFLWGASTAAHQTEGNNINSDWWQAEVRDGSVFPDRSGDAVDGHHSFREDIAALAASGLNAYRFSVEWARVEPAPGMISYAELAHYRRIVDTCAEFGVAPVVTLHHFTLPRWFAELGGWSHPEAVSLFECYVRTVVPIVESKVAHGDAFVGVQAYTYVQVDADGAVPPQAGTRLTKNGWPFYPRALHDRVTLAHQVAGVPVLVTENGVATDDDGERIEYIDGALNGLDDAVRAEVPVLGYLHWTFLDNYEWGSYAPTFGFIDVDRMTFERTPKPSLAHLGACASERR